MTIHKLLFAFTVLVFDRLVLRTSGQGDDLSFWRETCTPGNCQAPIDIDHRKVILDYERRVIKTPLNFKNYGKMEMNVQNTGLLVTFTPKNTTILPILSGGPTRQDYVFDSFHFHRFGEHTIDGKEFPLEFHMVHRKANITLDEAKTQRDGIVVFGILCDFENGPIHKGPLAQLIPNVKKTLTPGKSYNAGTIDIRSLIPNKLRIYAYLGSLTMAPFQEAVIWIVYKRHLTVTSAQFKVLSSVRYNNNTATNNRELQPSNHRKIYTVTSGDDTDWESNWK